VHEPDLFHTSISEKEVQAASRSSPTSSSKPKRTVVAITPGVVAGQDKKSEWESFDDPEKGDVFKAEHEREPCVDQGNVEDRFDHWHAFANDENEFADDSGKFAVDEDNNPPVDDTEELGTEVHRPTGRRPIPIPEPVLPGAFREGGTDNEEEYNEDELTFQSPTEPPIPPTSSRPPDVMHGLAMATAVEGEDSSLPAAIEYDPRSKPPLVSNRRFQLYALVGVVLLIGVVIGVVVGVRKKESPGPPEPTLAPTTLLEKSYRAQFVAEVGVQVNVPGSAHDRAAEWIISEDPRALPPEAPNLIQRYHLALLYYLTTQNNKTRWNSCNPPMSNETEFCTFQEVQWDNSYEDIPNQTRWMAGVHECEWIGISCDPTLNVIELDFGK
jgi:hypothetical protein